MVMVTIQEAAEQLQQLVESALNGETVVIVGDDQQIVRLIREEKMKSKRKAGSAKGLIWMADDFEAPLDDFAEYME